jgi:hypothetical protein
MTNIVASFNTEWNATSQVTSKPTTDYTCAPLTPSAVKSSLCDWLFSAYRTFHFDWVSLSINLGSSFVLSKLFSSEKISEPFLPFTCLLFVLVGLNGKKWILICLFQSSSFFIRFFLLFLRNQWFVRTCSIIFDSVIIVVIIVYLVCFI